MVRCQMVFSACLVFRISYHTIGPVPALLVFCFFLYLFPDLDSACSMTCFLVWPCFVPCFLPPQHYPVCLCAGLLDCFWLCLLPARHCSFVSVLYFRLSVLLNWNLKSDLCLPFGSSVNIPDTFSKLSPTFGTNWASSLLSIGCYCRTIQGFKMFSARSKLVFLFLK